MNEDEKVPRMKIDEPPTPYYKSTDKDFGEIGCVVVDSILVYTASVSCKQPQNESKGAMLGVWCAPSSLPLVWRPFVVRQVFS